MARVHNAMAALAASPAFAALARSLWQETELRGAALMAGAGLSRNAGTAAFDSLKPPLWGDLLQVMRNELNLDAMTAPGALKLAGRYEEMFGRGRLEGLIRRLIPDASWVPGELHMRLLRLPWTEVLTTNYDTLLERAADHITDPVYEVALTPVDLARTRSPRIVKLHGTLPSHTPFVITENDYRAYPARCAPFVNLARQVLIENDVCMLGFSGDDPNFTAWTGWVQAELAPYGRTLFLVGIFDLTGEARDAYLARGITPIDLAPFVPDVSGDRDERSAAALELFLGALEAARSAPPESWSPMNGWPRTSGPPPDPAEAWLGLHHADFAGRYVAGCVERWRAERRAYPGWFQPPPSVRARVELHLRDHMLALERGHAHAGLTDVVGAVADVLWRLDLVHGSLYQFDLAWLEPVLQAADPHRLSAADRRLLGRLLLRTHREAEDRAAFDRWRAWLVPTAERDTEVRALLAYEEALWARDHLDFSAVAANVEAVRGSDPAWTLRRAMLLAELGQHEAMEKAVLEAFLALKALSTRDRRSLWIRSRFAWSWLLANALTRTSAPDERVPEFVAENVAKDNRLRRFDEGDCNPWPCLEALDTAITAGEKQAQDDAAGPRSAFDPGIVQRPGVTLRAMVAATADRYGARLADHVGIPAAMRDRINLMQSRLARAVGAFAAVDRIGTAQALVAASRGEKHLIEQRFNRVAVARLDGNLAGELFTRARRALDYVLLQRSVTLYWTKRAGALTELMSRLVVRLPNEEARRCLGFAMDLARQPGWRQPVLFEPLDHLISRSLDAMVPAERTEVALDLISFPLPSEAGVNGGIGWPEPGRHIQAGMTRTCNDARWAGRIGQLLGAAEHGEQIEASKATARLLYLARAGLLSADERVSFGRAFWERRRRLREPGLPVDLAIPAVFETPAPAEDERRAMLRRLVLGTPDEQHSPSPGGVWLLRRMAELPEGVRAYLEEDDLLTVFDGLAAWRLPETPAEIPELINARSIHEGLGQGIVAALARAVLPAMTADWLGEDRLAVLRDLVCEPPLPDHISLAPQAVRLGALNVEDATMHLQDSLLDMERRRMTAALWSVGEWAVQHQRGEGPALPDQLVTEVVGLVGMRVSRALPEALQTATTLTGYGGISPADARRLTIGLEHLMVEAAYSSWAGDDAQTARLTLIRADAARLAEGLIRGGHGSAVAERWLTAAAADELPEVRFAAP